jgi:hypothetical protein
MLGFPMAPRKSSCRVTWSAAADFPIEGSAGGDTVAVNCNRMVVFQVSQHT